MSREISLVRGDEAGQSTQKLSGFYADNLIPAEKKPYLTRLKSSRGPFLATEQDEYILDGSSQIATLGLGFNASPLFGVTHFLEAWTNNKQTAEIHRLRESYTSFFRRKLGWEKVNAFFCHSGAEANEIALGQCFRNRKSDKQTKVLAFEGSFHGRFLVSLASTWNPVKRQLFEWPSFTSQFVPYPEMKNDYKKQGKIPAGWQAFWEDACSNTFAEKIQAYYGRESLMDSELKVLEQIRTHLVAGEIFAILAEPMQCEGGDRYTSFRFHQALLNLARSFQVPLIYDEVQTGFALGGPFFWHRLFALKDGSGNCIAPDYVVCAKKAQVGIVLSKEAITHREQYHVASLIRGYIQATALDQAQQKIEDLEKEVRKQLPNFIRKFNEQLSCPRAQGLCFSFDFADKDLLGQFIKKRFSYGLLYYPAGSHTARFRLNLGYGKKEIKLLFEGMTSVLNECLGKKTKSLSSFLPPPAQRQLRSFHETLVEWKSRELSSGKRPSLKQVSSLLQDSLVELTGDEKYKLKFVNRRNFGKYRSKIARVQRLTYEPVRQTPIADFETAMRSPHGIGILIEKGKELVGIAFAGDLAAFPLVRGVRQDPYYEQKKILYSIDVTVIPKYQGLALGRFLRYSMVAIAFQQGIKAIHGRNRDRVAGSMWAINLSLGCLELQHLENDYPDLQQYRDCLYYRNVLNWREPAMSLSTAVDSPLSFLDVDNEFFQSNRGCIVNKVCLSNFVSEPYLNGLKGFLEKVPSHLRHGYSTSGQSECVDKVVKSIWRTRQVEKLLTFKDQFFGHGSFLSRGLSGEVPSFFPIDSLDFPTEQNWQQVLGQVQECLSQAKYHSVWVEPLTQILGWRMPIEFLQELKKVCAEHNTPLVSNDTASLFHRYDPDHFVASGAFEPDAGFSYLGGQFGISYLKDELFVSDPLALISTWDGDEFSLAAFQQASHRFDLEKARDIRSRFDSRLKEVLARYPVENIEIENGIGTFRGTLPTKLAGLFEYLPEYKRYRVFPTEREMERFLAEEGGK